MRKNNFLHITAEGEHTAGFRNVSEDFQSKTRSSAIAEGRAMRRVS